MISLQEMWDREAAIQEELKKVRSLLEQNRSQYNMLEGALFEIHNMIKLYKDHDPDCVG